jgi:hypothetical protein
VYPHFAGLGDVDLQPVFVFLSSDCECNPSSFVVGEDPFHLRGSVFKAVLRLFVVHILIFRGLFPTARLVDFGSHRVFVHRFLFFPHFSFLGRPPSLPFSRRAAFCAGVFALPPSLPSALACGFISDPAAR